MPGMAFSSSKAARVRPLFSSAVPPFRITRTFSGSPIRLKRIAGLDQRQDGDQHRDGERDAKAVISVVVLRTARLRRL